MATDEIVAQKTMASIKRAAPGLGSWPADRPTVEVIAERMLMSALRNYRIVKRGGSLGDFATYDELTIAEVSFYGPAVDVAYRALFGGR